MLFKVIVAGSRTFKSYEFMCDWLDHYLRFKHPDVQIISGGAPGADKLAERYAKETNYPCMIIKADWNTYGKSAGYRRNVEMAELADAAVVFWDGKSRGAKHMIDIATKKQLPLKVINYVI